MAQWFALCEHPLIEVRPALQAKTTHKVVAVQACCIHQRADALCRVRLRGSLAEQRSEQGNIQRQVCLGVEKNRFVFRDDPAFPDKLRHLPQRVAQVRQGFCLFIFRPEQGSQCFARVSLVGMLLIPDSQVRKQRRDRAAAGCDRDMVESDLRCADEQYRKMHKETPSWGFMLAGL